MGITLDQLEWMRSAGYLIQGQTRILDLGTSNLYQAPLDRLTAFIAAHHGDMTPQIESTAARLAKGSEYNETQGGRNEAFVGELLEICGYEYCSLDIAEGFKTTVLDLNFQKLPAVHAARFQLVMNFGTSEHVLNQMNCFALLHDATASGGIMIHQLPVSGWTDHGLFVYTGRLFFELASHNRYEVLDVSYDYSDGASDDLFQSARAYESQFGQLRRLRDRSFLIPRATLTIVYQKTGSSGFIPCLEVSTSAGQIPTRVRLSYTANLAAAGGRISDYLGRLWARHRK